MPEFVEFAGKKEYKCPRCKAPIRYAKFFGPDKKILTTDGKEAWAGEDEQGKFKTNTGWPTNPETKQMHECKTELLQPLNEVTADTRILRGVKDVPEDTGWEDPNEKQSLTEIDKKVRDRIIQDAYEIARFKIWKLQGVEKACKELGIEFGAKSGMIFNAVDREERKAE